MLQGSKQKGQIPDGRRGISRKAVTGNRGEDCVSQDIMGLGEREKEQL
jgi:hypothetical protein